MSIAKQILRPLLIVLLLCLAGEGLYRLLFYQHDREAYTEGMSRLPDKISQTGADVLYLGESSNHTYGLDDEDTAWISEMIARELPDMVVLDMTHDAAHSEVYYYLLRNIKHNCPIGTVVVTMNLRSFGIGWIASPLETALQKRLVMLQGGSALVRRAMLTFKSYDIKSEDERYGQMDEHWATHPLPGHPSVPQWGDSLNEARLAIDSSNLPGTFVRNFAFLIDTATNPRVRDFDRIVQLAKQRGWRLIFNLLPENMQLTDSLVGTDLCNLMRQNRDILVRHYANMGVTVVDNLESVDDAQFRDRDWTTEHYLQEGRRTIAKNVAAAIRQQKIPKKKTRISGVSGK